MESSMRRLSREVTVPNRQGMHARPSHLFVETANRFESEVEIALGDHSVNGKSIMMIMTLAAECGTRLVITTQGPDAEQALAALCGLVQQGFHED
jgi:phosphocarrier protein